MSYRHPSESDVKIMLQKRKIGFTIREIAEYTGFSKSCVDRNLKLCKYVLWKVIKGKRRKIYEYDIKLWIGHKDEIYFWKEKAWFQNSQNKFADFIKFAHHLLKQKINNQRVQYSPFAIIDLFQQNASNFTPSLTIFYHWINHRKFGFKISLFKNMRKYYKKQKLLGKRAVKFISIHKRYEEANLRLTNGHMEIDTVEGKKGDRFALATMIDRKTRKVALHLYKNKCSKSFLQATLINLRKFAKVKSITIDNGLENSLLGILQEKYKIDLYNTDAYASYQKGSIENMHKFIRRFKPKHTTLDNLNYEMVFEIEQYINKYPRLILKKI